MDNQIVYQVNGVNVSKGTYDESKGKKSILYAAPPSTAALQKRIEELEAEFEQAIIIAKKYCKYGNEQRAVEAEIRALKADDVQAPKEGRETAWLVEKDVGGFPNYLYCDCIGVLNWTPSNQKAMRFARKEDAASIVSIVEDADRVAEHMWIAAAPTDTEGK